ncbi:DUF502 domain-containing protein [Cloacibacillus evryensis]|uniref:DUF502 domain-containing protein n=1 Tax=Cloacibacillus evryensis TaxID=508460 RepID=A0AAW5JYY5_9BACT|nr:DUF502 domain-containing protein [Cloacibacillus evryensis]EHL69540.1 hypothetical protein HMPREF1006_01897 [Synergistes sp. 3_1_syn1]MCQ4813765.1 DUF502 domain-containing protein [Cloacibacillus evryensis]MEA5036484.1 DUF502 domain-containing protein [Cloacibacillus evryensis]
MDPDKNNDTAKKPDKGNVSFMGRLGRDFFLGCVAFLPLALFIFLFYYLIYFFESIGSVIFGITQSRRTTVAISVFLVFLLIYIGRKLRRRERSILNLLEQFIITKIPVVGGWYTTFRDILQTFTARGGENSYLGTAKVPVAGGYIIGFVSRREVLADGTAQLTVFVPTSPNPTTGLVFFFPEEEVEYLDMTPEKAFTKIISLGVKS